MFILSQDRCEGKSFDCTFNNPCSPLCEDGVMSYPGRTRRQYVQCSSDGVCFEKRCKETRFNADTRECEESKYINSLRMIDSEHKCVSNKKS